MIEQPYDDLWSLGYVSILYKKPEEIRTFFEKGVCNRIGETGVFSWGYNGSFRA